MEHGWTPEAGPREAVLRAQTLRLPREDSSLQSCVRSFSTPVQTPGVTLKTLSLLFFLALSNTQNLHLNSQGNRQGSRRAGNHN